MPMEAIDPEKMPDGLSVTEAPTIEIMSGSYINNNQLVPRPIMGTTLSGLVLSAVPLGAVLTISGPTGKSQQYTTDSETVNLAFPKAGLYKLNLNLWPYMPNNFEVIV